MVSLQGSVGTRGAYGVAPGCHLSYSCAGQALVGKSSDRPFRMSSWTPTSHHKASLTRTRLQVSRPRAVGGMRGESCHPCPLVAWGQLLAMLLRQGFSPMLLQVSLLCCLAPNTTPNTELGALKPGVKSSSSLHGQDPWKRLSRCPLHSPP